MGIRRVIGVGLSGVNLSATFGKIEVPLLSVAYGDMLEPAALSAMGAQEQDEWSDGTYKTEECTFKVSAVTWRSQLLPAMPVFGGGNVRIPVVVSMSHPDLGSDSDFLDSVRLTKWPKSGDNTNAVFEHELKGICRQIFWGELRKTINQLRGVPPQTLGAHQF